MHDLIRLYAAELGHHEVAEDVRDAAVRRVLDFYVHTANTADRLLESHRPQMHLDSPVSGVQPPPLQDVTSALAWFDNEHPLLLAAQRIAVSHDWHSTVWQLAWTLYTFHTRRGHRHDRLTVWRIALDAAAYLPSPTTVILAHRRLGHAYADLARHEEGIEHLHHALVLAKEHHDVYQQADTHQSLAWAWDRQSDHRLAFEHAIHALDLFRTLNQPVWEADALNLVGWCAARWGRYHIASTHCQAALALNRQHHDLNGEAGTLDSLGYIAHRTGQQRQAISYYRQSLSLFRSLDNIPSVAPVLEALGHPHVILSEYEQARIVWQEASALFQEQGLDADAARIQQQLDSLD
jgi:tetratricopeptide (TPR) repeat protein